MDLRDFLCKGMNTISDYLLKAVSIASESSINMSFRNSNISMRNKSSFNTMLKRCLLHEPFLGPQDCSSLSHVQVSWGRSETHLKLEFFVSWAGSFSKPWASSHKGCILIPVCISKSAQHGELHRTVTYQWLSELNVIKPDSASSTFYLLAWKDGKEKKNWVKWDTFMDTKYIADVRVVWCICLKISYIKWLQFTDILGVGILKGIRQDTPSKAYVDFIELPMLCGTCKMRGIKPIKLLGKPLERNKTQEGNHAEAAAARLPKLCQTAWVVRAKLGRLPTGYSNSDPLLRLPWEARPH